MVRVTSLCCSVYRDSRSFLLPLQLRVPSLAHDIADLREVQMYARVQAQDDFVLGRADETAVLWKEAGFGAVRDSKSA